MKHKVLFHNKQELHTVKSFSRTSNTKHYVAHSPQITTSFLAKTFVMQSKYFTNEHHYNASTNTARSVIMDYPRCL